MTTEELHKEYIGLTKEISILDIKKKTIASQLIEGMESEELTTTESDLGKVTITERAFYKYSEKVDGTNIRIMFDGEKVTYNGKTDNAQLHGHLVQKLHDLFDSQLELFKETFEPNKEGITEVCFYGEGYGAGIQKAGGNYSKDKSFVMFDIKIGKVWLEREDIEEIAKKFGIDVVPIIGKGTLDKMEEMTKKGFNSQWGDFIAEGIVARPETQMFNRRGERIIVKLKYIDFNK